MLGSDGYYMQQLLATTDVTSMARLIGEAYQVTRTQERDVTEIKEHYAAVMLTEANLHTEIMTGLENGFAERRAAIAIIQMQITAMTSAGHHDKAQELTLHFIELMRKSPTDAALHSRNSFYKR